MVSYDSYTQLHIFINKLYTFIKGSVTIIARLFVVLVVVRMQPA